MRIISLLLAFIAFIIFVAGFLYTLNSSETWKAADFLIAGITTGLLSSLFSKI